MLSSITFAMAAAAGLAFASPTPLGIDLGLGIDLSLGLDVALLEAAVEVATGPISIGICINEKFSFDGNSISSSTEVDVSVNSFFYKGPQCAISHDCGSGWGCGTPIQSQASWSMVTTTVTTSCPTQTPTATTTRFTNSTTSRTATPTAPPGPCPTIPEPGTYCGFINPEDACAPQPGGYGPHVEPDTVEAFYAYAPFHALAAAAPSVVPSSDRTQYTEVFKDLNAAVSANSYLGLYTLTSYNAQECAAKCDTTALCTSFNLYIERDPSLAPANNDNTTATPWTTYCPNPPSITNYKCTLWGSSITAALATNRGETREDFQVVITGSNGWDKTAVTTPDCVVPPSNDTTVPPCTVKPGNNCGPYAIFAPFFHLGSKFFPGPFNVQLCLDLAIELNEYKRQSAIAAGETSFTPCKMFNPFFVHKDGKPFGTYCSLYSAALDDSWAVFSGLGRYQTQQSWTFELDIEAGYYSW
jgi:hypothetical protein